MYRILIADDEDFAREGLERIISKIPETKVAAVCKNGLEAREYLEENIADAVLSDIRMPNMDGLELAEWVSVNRKECKVILLSAYGEFSYAQKAVKFGVKDYLMKPIRAIEIRNVIDQLIQEKNREQEERVWVRDLKQELIELDIYHALVDNENPIAKERKKEIYFSRYQFQIKNKSENTTDLIMTGLTNVLRWYAPQCTPVMEKSGEEIEYILISDKKNAFPEREELEEKILKLLKVEMKINNTASTNIEALTEQKFKLVQDEMEDVIVLKAKEYIREHLKDNLSREEVADYVHLDSSYFSKYFKKKSGVTFSDYLMENRMEKVQTLLDKGWKVYDAALEAGFQNRNYFNTVFKKYAGMNPTKYKHRPEELRKMDE